MTLYFTVNCISDHLDPIIIIVIFITIIFIVPNEVQLHEQNPSHVHSFRQCIITDLLLVLADLILT